MKSNFTQRGRHIWGYRNRLGSIAEFAPAFVLLTLAFFAILSVAQLLLCQMAAQKCCLDAAALAASSLTIQSGTALVEQEAKTFNLGWARMLLVNDGKHGLAMRLSWTPVPAPTSTGQTENSTERYATVTGEIDVQPFCFPASIKMKSSAQCLLEHPEGWVPRQLEPSGVKTY